MNKKDKQKKSKNKSKLCDLNNCRTNHCTPCGGIGFYGLGFVGAVIYYISTASGFWMGLLGVFKAIIWPLFLVYELFKYLGM